MKIHFSEHGYLEEKDFDVFQSAMDKVLIGETLNNDERRVVATASKAYHVALKNVRAVGGVSNAKAKVEKFKEFNLITQAEALVVSIKIVEDFYNGE